MFTPQNDPLTVPERAIASTPTASNTTTPKAKQHNPYAQPVPSPMNQPITPVNQPITPNTPNIGSFAFNPETAGSNLVTPNVLPVTGGHMEGTPGQFQLESQRQAMEQPFTEPKVQPQQQTVVPQQQPQQQLPQHLSQPQQLQPQQQLVQEAQPFMPMMQPQMPQPQQFTPTTMYPQPAQFSASAPVTAGYAPHQQYAQAYVQPQYPQQAYAQPHYAQQAYAQPQYVQPQYPQHSYPTYYPVQQSYGALAYAQAYSAPMQAPAVQQPQPQPQPQQQQMQRSHTQQQQQQQGNGRERNEGGWQNEPSYDEVIAFSDNLLEQAKTASGSSFIQASLKEGGDERIVTLLWDELGEHVRELLLDAHGCYVMKSLMERLPPAAVAMVLQTVKNEEQLGFAMCTQSLHTRRVVQHIIETIDGNFLNDLMQRRCVEVAKTQQGCIVIQRSLDHSSGQARDALMAKVMHHLVDFSMDPYANYVIQHLLEIGDREAISDTLWMAVQGSVIKLSCNKFASNVVEKCLLHVTARVQREILTEMYGAGPKVLYDMLQDSFGNYIIQSSIALATFADVGFIDEKLRPVLAHTPYGFKIEARLDRRLKGQPVTARTPLLSHGDKGGQSGNRRTSRGPRTTTQRQNLNLQQYQRNATADIVPAGEVPW